MSHSFTGLVVLLGVMVPFAPLSARAYAGQAAASASQAAGSVADGVWLGALHVGAQTLRLQLHLEQGGAKCSLDSLDQKASGIPCTVAEMKGDKLSIDVPKVGGKLSGTISADGKTLTGTWTQGGNALPLVMERQTAAAAVPKVAMDPAMPPVGVADLKAVLDRDLAQALKDGALAPSTHTGVTIGVVQGGVQRIFSYGTAKDDSVFEIGSITKTFTGLILAQMVEQGSVRLDEPVRALLPEGTVAKPAADAEITLLDLSDQHSGLPRMPDNFHPADENNPYADYDAKLLYAFVAKQGVAMPVNASFGYSNVGVGLLGQALADRAKVSYSTLLHEQITGPLKMNDTAIALTPEMKARFIEGHDTEHNPAHAWDLDALVGAGGIRSTAADMLIYLEAQLHPDRLAASVAATPNGKTLAAAIAKSHVIHADVSGGTKIALNWFHVDESGSFWHNGGTGGYSSFAAFNPEKDFAIVVLTNVAPGPDAMTDTLGQHIVQRLRGVEAVSLVEVQRKTVYVDEKVLEGYVGSYQLTPTFVMTITREGDRLFEQATGQGKAEMFAESEKDFFFKVVNAQITFETDAQGKTTGLVLHQGGDHEAMRVK
jgi:serine-type D-Ala-D-Ala carboxypeptidase/endopeptidase